MANALAQERSPYLRQHQSNPVDWQPWGDAAFEDAQRLNRPVLLSIGYSACHWCHVMARESFADPQTAALMNANFVNVKVDREERPDVDAVYVRALQAMGRRAGWPLTIFLTPQGRPFWGGTYFPPRERDGLPAFREVLEQISTIYRADPASVEEKAASLMTKLLAEERRTGGELTDAAILAAAEDLLAHIDAENGGLRGPSKFPYPVLFRFLWNMGRRAGRADFRAAARLTARRITERGLFDHVGGGFFRYTVDPQWNVPHFEKMLYDTALLIGFLTEMGRSGEEPACAGVVRRSADWLLREMTLAGGAFACSLDAESEGREGAYYLWRGAEIDAALGARAGFFRTWFDLGGAPDLADGHVLRLSRSRREARAEDVAQLDACCDALLRARARRVPPRRDDKVLADWNGLAISALAGAAAVFDEPAWLTAAQRAFVFVAGEMRRGEVLCHSWCESELGAAGVLDDYANMALAALALLEATGEADYLRHAQSLAEQCVDRFRDPDRGGFYYTAADASLIPLRMCDPRDTATPSGNGIMCEVLGRLWCATGEDRYRELAQGVVAALAGDVERDSFQLASVMEAGQFMRGATRITLIGRASDPALRALSAVARRHAPPDRFVQVVANAAQLSAQHFAFGKSGAGDGAAALVCRNAACSLPITRAADLQRVLGEQDGFGPVV